MLRLRPHHGMCIGQFIGKGYSQDFVENMYRVIEKLKNNPDDKIQLVCAGDEICKACPHFHHQICESGQKVFDYDKACLELCNLKEGDQISWREFQKRVYHNIIMEKKISQVCVHCQWITICVDFHF